MKPTSNLRSYLALAGASLLAVSCASAGQIWDGSSAGPGDDNWNTAANWDSDILPTFTNAITFTGNDRNGAVNNLTADSIIGGIDFTNDGSTGKTNAFTLSSARITLGGNIATTASSSAITDIISLAMIFNADRTITTHTNHNLTISGVISESGTRGLIKEGAGTLTLSVNNTYTGNTTVSAGTAKIAARDAFGIRSTPVTRVTVASGATVDFNAITDATYGYTISGTGVGGLGALVNTGAEITTGVSQATNIRLADHTTIGGTGNWAMLAGGYGVTSLDLNAKTLTKAGANTITLVNTTTTAGNLQVDAGILAFGASPGGALGVTGAASAITLANTSGVNLNVVRNSSIGSLAGGGPSGGNVNISSGITLTVGALNTDTIFAGVIGGSGGLLTKTGTGTLTLTNNNTYTGNTIVSAGTVKIEARDAFGARTTPVTRVTVASGATVDFNGIPDATYGYTISGTGVGGLGALINTGVAITTGVSQATNIRLADHATIGGTGNWAMLAGGFGVTSLDLNAKTLTKAGANTITLVNTTTTAGDIQVDAGTLAFGAGSTAGVTGAASAITLANTSGVNLNVVRNSSIGSLAGGGASGGNVTISNGITFTVGALNTDTSFAGAVGGSGGVLTKTGNGILTLTNTNTYSGSTAIDGGTLVITGATQATSAITFGGGKLGLDIASPVAAASATINFTGQTVLVTGSPTLPSYTLLTALSIPGTAPTLAAPAPAGYELKVESNTLKLVKLGYASWAALNGAGPNLNDDHDNDGVDNGTEYFLGGPNGPTTGFTALPGITNTLGILSITWNKGAGYIGAYNTDFVVETSTTLSDPWTVEASPGNVADSPASVIYTFPGGPAYSGKRFARLKVTGP